MPGRFRVMIEFVGDGGDLRHKFHGLIEAPKPKCVAELSIDELPPGQCRQPLGQLPVGESRQPAAAHVVKA
ncbi:Uncharacterised protein [Mycobacterium tuberculosis]|nr:Uncharacterised protein [Mycobacterium tuberculosis]